MLVDRRYDKREFTPSGESVRDGGQGRRERAWVSDGQAKRWETDSTAPHWQLGGKSKMGSRVAAAHFPDKYLAGVPQLLEDLQRLAEDTDSADIVFLVGREEVPVYAHRIILMAR
ncbi:hypothetical protein WDU94_006519 [Cyamophila willieti]